MSSSPDTLPGCFTHFGKPTALNKCDVCPVKNDCQKYLPKESLKPILDRLTEVKLVLKGEKIWEK